MLQRGVTETHWRWDQQIWPTVVIKEPAEGSNLDSQSDARVKLASLCVCVRETERERERGKERGVVHRP